MRCPRTLTTFAERVWNQPARGVFFLNASSGIPMPFVQALKAMDYIVVPLSGTPDEKVVDIAIQRTLRALAQRAADVLLVSHDRTFLDNIVTSTLAFEGLGRVTEYVGGWADYVRQTTSSGVCSDSS